MDFLEFLQKELEFSKKCRSYFSPEDSSFDYFNGKVVAFELAFDTYKHYVALADK